MSTNTPGKPGNDELDPELRKALEAIDKLDEPWVPKPAQPAAAGSQNNGAAPDSDDRLTPVQDPPPDPDFGDRETPVQEPPGDDRPTVRVEVDQMQADIAASARDAIIPGTGVSLRAPAKGSLSNPGIRLADLEVGAVDVDTSALGTDTNPVESVSPAAPDEGVGSAANGIVPAVESPGTTDDSSDLHVVEELLTFKDFLEYNEEIRTFLERFSEKGIHFTPLLSHLTEFTYRERSSGNGRIELSEPIHLDETRMREICYSLFYQFTHFLIQWLELKTTNEDHILNEVALKKARGIFTQAGSTYSIYLTDTIKLFKSMMQELENIPEAKNGMMLCQEFLSSIDLDQAGI